jgi:hypothetical protein
MYMSSTKATRQQRAEKAELRPALDHLRNAEARSLNRVVGHEEPTDEIADQDRPDRPGEIESDRDCEHPVDESGDLDVAREPDGEQMPRFAMALVGRDVVDRTVLQRSA